jgi:effector-binding domain-containing protein
MSLRIFRLPCAAIMIIAWALVPALGQTSKAPAAASPRPAPPAVSPPASAATPNDPFGEQVMLSDRPIVYYSGSGLWDSAYATITKALKSVYGAIEQQGLKRNGAPMIIYTATDDTGFQFWAAAPIEQPPATLPGGELKVGKSPAGKALKFVHRGSFDEMDITYEAITNYLDDKRLEARDVFIEQYVTDPVTTPDDELVVEIYVPLK